MTVGTWVHMLLLAFVVITTTDWTHEAYRAKERLVVHGETVEILESAQDEPNIVVDVVYQTTMFEFVI